MSNADLSTFERFLTGNPWGIAFVSIMLVLAVVAILHAGHDQKRGG